MRSLKYENQDEDLLVDIQNVERSNYQNKNKNIDLIIKSIDTKIKKFDKDMMKLSGEI